MKKKFINEPYSCNQGFWVRILRIMKITVLLLLICTSGIYANSYSQSAKFTFQLENATVKEVFETIQEQSEFIIFYKDSYIDLNRKVSVEVDNSNIEQIFEQVFEGTNLTYKIIDRQVVIVPEKKKSETKSESIEESFEQSQKKTIAGKVTDEEGEPLPGVSIVVKGTTTGITTDFDENYLLEIPDDAEILLFSFVGMKGQEITISGQS